MRGKKSAVGFAFVVLAIVLMCELGTTYTYANSAQTQWRGTDMTGAVIYDEESPIVVEKEVLTLDIQEFPSNYYDNAEDFFAYQSKVTAEYTFYNPSDYTVTARLFFPFGEKPTYRDGYYDKETEDFVYFDDTQLYQVTVNGQSIETKIRHTLSYEEFGESMDENLDVLTDETDDNFYYPEQTVTKYTFKISDLDNERYPAACVGFDFSPKDADGKRKYYFAEESGFKSLKNEKYRVDAWAENGETITLFIIGEPLEKMPTWTFYEDGGVEDRDKIAGNIKLISTEKMSFKEWAMSYRTGEITISENDWMRAMITDLKCSEEVYVSGLLCRNGGFEYLEYMLMRWYEYEITLGPGERIVNTVTAPLYPDINARYEPPVFDYTYLLSPAKTWKEFGPIEVVINTPYYMLDSSLEGFEEMYKEASANDEAGENADKIVGYVLHLDGLPEGELEIKLCASEKPVTRAYSFKNDVPRELVVPLIGGAIVLLGIGVAVAVVRYKRKHL